MQFNENINTMLNDSELATLRNRFKRDAELLMQTTTAGDDDEKSKVQKHLTLLANFNRFLCCYHRADVTWLYRCSAQVWALTSFLWVQSET